jgi:hypothetical protein
MEYIGVFYDYDEEGHPIFAIHDEDENWLFSVPLPLDTFKNTNFEIGDEFRIIPLRTS